VTFAIRTITRSATGGDIVHRPQLVESDEVVIGRGADCDVRLADLAVNLRHARLRQTGPGKVLVESLGAEPFETASKFTTRAELKLSDKPTLTFGSHVLALSASEENDDVLIDVTRLEGAPEGASAVNERKIFSLGSPVFGKRPVAWALGILIALACLAWPVVTFVTNSNRTIHADKQWSTGPLSKSHAFLGQNCQACHVKAFVSVRDDACLGCHRATANPEAARLVSLNERRWGGPEKVSLIREHAAHDRLLRATPLPKDLVGHVKALFERQFDHRTERCASCHLEHLADTPAKGAAAGAAAKPHVIPVLHQTNDCASCHARLRRSLGSTSLRDTPDWTHHPEFRPLIARTPMGQGRPILDRISLVQQPSDYTGLIFSHQQHLSATGGVARMASGLHFKGGALQCADCHRADKSGKGFLPVEMTRDCASCHSLAFAPGPGGVARNLPHGHPDQVIATLQTYYGAGGGAGAVAGPRKPPGFLAGLGQLIAYHPAQIAGSSKIRALFAPRGLCSECHAAVAPADPASFDYKIKPIHLTDRYLPRGDFNHDIPEHKRDAAGRPTCDNCHNASGATAANQVLLPRVSACASCHGKTKDKIATAASADCTECHSFHAPGVATPRPDRAAAASSVAGAKKTAALTAHASREF
jgi:hypothetical protein